MDEPLTAVILAGGRGERLQPYTLDRPKAMVPVAGRPILFHQLSWLRGCGVGRVVLACGYRHEVIEKAVGDGSVWGIEIFISVERTKLGRGGALKLALHAASPRRTFVALNGDLITDLDLRALLDHHESANMPVTVAAAPFRSSHGIVLLDRGKITGFEEKPVLPYWISAGIYAMSPEIIERLPDVGDHEDGLFPELARSGELGWFPIPGRWYSIDTAKDVADIGRALGAAPSALGAEEVGT